MMDHSHQFLIVEEYDQPGTDWVVEAVWRCWKRGCEETTTIGHYSLREFDEARADANEQLSELLLAVAAANGW